MSNKKMSYKIVVIFLLCFFQLRYGNIYAQSWVTNGPTYKNIKSVSHSPTNTNIIYAGAFGWGVFKSTDAGASWINYKTGLTNTHVRSIMALSDNKVFVGTNDGVFKTIDGGLTFVLSLSTLHSVRALAYDSKSSALYAATYGSGLFKSLNDGSTWQSISVNDPSVPVSMPHLWSIAVFGKDSLYVGGSISDIGSGGALFESIDGGLSWFQVQTGIGIRSSVKSIAISPTDPDVSLIIGTAAKGVYRSTNAGLNWSQYNATTIADSIDDKKINAVGFNTTQRYAGSDSLGKFYYRSVGNLSAGWLVGTGLPGSSAIISAIDIDVPNRNVVFVGTEGRGTYKSIDSGFTWQHSNSGMLGTAGRSIKLNGNGNLILGTDFGDGIWISTNQAASWTRQDSLSTSDAITSIGISNNNSILYAGAYGMGVHKSTDGGHIWRMTDTSTINHFVRCLNVHPLDANIVYAGTGNGVYKTINGGTSWVATNNGIPLGTSIRSMEINLTNPNLIYVGSDSSYMYKSTDAGVNWVQVSNANGFLPQDKFIRSITIDHNFANLIYAGSDSGRIYKSTDAGLNWYLLVKLPATHSVRNILLDPNNNQILFAATFGDGIFVSVNGGANWASYNNGLSDLEIYSLESDNATPLNLYAGSGSHGVFHITFVNTNHPPHIAPIGNKSTYAGSNLAFTISATDSDGTIPTLSVSGLPSGASFLDSLNGHASFRWTPTISQLGSFAVTFKASDGSLVDSVIVTINVFDSLTSKIFTMHLDDGWNLISIPLVVSNPRSNALFPTAISQAFFYSNTYVQKDTLKICNGYWLKFPSSQTIQIGGTILMNDTINVSTGWNMIGTLFNPISINNIIPIAPLAITSNYFDYSVATGYTSKDTLQPGRGYWVKVNQSGKIILNTPSAIFRSGNESSELVNLTKDDRLSSLTFVNKNGFERQLFLANSHQSNNLQNYELPPLPPQGVFDVRFATQRNMAYVDDNTRYPIDISDAGSLSTVRWNINENNTTYSLDLFDESNNSTNYILFGRGSVNINNMNISSATIHVIRKQLNEIPRDFVIEQNYPNPFNPTTTLRYAIPLDAKVTLNVYNLIGQKVSILVNSIQPKGYHSVVWDAESFANGVYFYNLLVTETETGKILFQSTRKIILAK